MGCGALGVRAAMRFNAPQLNLNKKSEETANGPRHLPPAASYTCRKQRSHRHGKLEPENEASEVP